MKKEQPAVRVFKDGREACNLLTKSGRDEYTCRKIQMRNRQNKLCCLCGKFLSLADTTFEHQDGRGMGAGHRDDRTEKDGNPYNGVSHWKCNYERGSKHTDFCIVP